MLLIVREDIANGELGLDKNYSLLRRDKPGKHKCGGALLYVLTDGSYTSGIFTKAQLFQSRCDVKTHQFF